MKKRLLDQWKPLSWVWQMSLPLKALALGVVIGLLAWTVLDWLQTDRLQRILTQQLERELEQQSGEARVDFTHHIHRQRVLLDLVAQSQDLIGYLKDRPWSSAQRAQYAPKSPPQWLGGKAIFRYELQGSHILLLDPQARLQEHYNLRQGELPAVFLLPDIERLRDSLKLNMILDIGSYPHVLMTHPIKDASDSLLGYLQMVLPLDDYFLIVSQQGNLSNGAVALIVDTRRETVLSSSDPNNIPAGMLLDQLKDSYLVTGQSYFRFGDRNSGVSFTTLVSKHTMAQINADVLASERAGRALSALAYVAIFSLVMVIISMRLERLLQRLHAFAYRTLGVSLGRERHGDQLIQLEQQFVALTDEVERGREQLQMRHENELRASETLRDTMLQASQDGILFLDEDGLIMDINPVAESMFHMQRDRLIGEDMAQILLPRPYSVRFRHGLLRYHSHQDADYMNTRREVEARRSDGSRFPVEMMIIPSRQFDSTIFTVLIHDISVRKATEKAMKGLAQFPAESPIPVLRVDASGVVVYANRASLGLLDYWNRRMGQTLPEYWRRICADALQKGQSQEMELNHGDQVFSLVVAPIVDMGYVNLYALDITARKRAEAEVRHHQSELVHVCRLSTMGEMTTGLAHELNNPLSAITNFARGATRRIENGVQDDEALLDAMSQIVRQAERASAIIRRLRGLVRKQETTHTEADINAVVSDTVDFNYFDLEKHNIQVEMLLDSSCKPQRMDVVQIEQVMLNLIRNSIDVLKDCPYERRITVQTERIDAGVMVRVGDNGPGLAGSDKDELFNPFYSTKPDGMGMGLAISTGIVEKHGGKMWADPLPERGVQFSFSLSANPVVPEYPDASDDTLLG